MLLSKLSDSLSMDHTLYGDDVEISCLCTDSRKIERGALFFCIPGLRSDAHQFAPQALANGAVALVVERRLPTLTCPQLLVRDAREATSYLAAAFYDHPAKKMHLIGITGTKGKTTSSFLTKAILEKAGKSVGLIGTVCSMFADQTLPSNLTTPDPIDFQRLLRHMADAGAEYVVMEVSAHALALKKLSGVFFDVAAFTNLSQDHFDFFGDMDHYLTAKLRLFQTEMCGQAFYNADDDRVSRAMRAARPDAATYGIRVSAGFYANDIEIGERGNSFMLTSKQRWRVPVNIHLAGVFNIYNAMTAAVLCDALGVGPEAIQSGLESVKSVPGRVELLETDTPYRVILDYAHSPDALENILTTVRQTAKARVIVLFGCGGDRDHEKRPIMGEIGGRLADLTILTSDNPRSEDPFDILDAIEEGIKPLRAEYIVIENRRQAIKYALSIARTGDVVVLAGKGHETYQEIKGVKYPFDEKVVVQELLDELHAQ